MNKERIFNVRIMDDIDQCDLFKGKRISLDNLEGFVKALRRKYN